MSEYWILDDTVYWMILYIGWYCILDDTVYWVILYIRWYCILDDTVYCLNIQKVTIGSTSTKHHAVMSEQGAGVPPLRKCVCVWRLTGAVWFAPPPHTHTHFSEQICEQISEQRVKWENRTSRRKKNLPTFFCFRHHCPGVQVLACNRWCSVFP